MTIRGWMRADALDGDTDCVTVQVVEPYSHSAHPGVWITVLVCPEADAVPIYQSVSSSADQLVISTPKKDA